MLKTHLAAAAAVAVCSFAAFGAHDWQKVDLREIKVRGEIGRREIGRAHV